MDDAEAGTSKEIFRRNDVATYGIWYGEGSAAAPVFKNGSSINLESVLKPIDEVDFYSFLHDKEQSAPDFKSHKEARWLESDINFVARLELYLERASDEQYKDKLTNRRPSTQAVERAQNAIRYFMGDLGIFGRFIDGEIPPKANKRGLSMEQIRNMIDEKKQVFRNGGKKSK